MQKNAICPFYGKNEDLCDVGCGYISPYDVKQIITFCSCHFGECLKYRELSDRVPEKVIDSGLCPV